MYVIPFWSYRHAGDGYLIRHYLTGQSLHVPPAMLDHLEAIYRTGQGHAEQEAFTALAFAAQILFADKAEADDWMSRSEQRTATTLPVIDQIELTNRCPYTCQMCPRTTSMDRALGDMPIDLFTTIVDGVKDRLEFVALHHFGESLMHRRLPEAVRIAKNLGVRTGLSCNPPSMRPELGRQLLQAGIANILFSLDSLDETVYRDIRGPVARIERADRNLREFVRLRDEGDFDTSVTLQMISMRANEAEADDFLRYCEDVGVDRGVVIRLGRWDFDEEKASGLGEVTAPGYTAPCSLPWHSVAVLWDGRVVPCCHDYNGAVVLGDLAERSLDEVWQSPEAQQFRDNCDSSELCRQCSASKPWREEQRKREGFRQFHHERLGGDEVRKEWVNPRSAGWRDGRRWFDRYDVIPESSPSKG